MEPLDSDLMRRAQRGDQGAFHALVDRHAQGLYALAVTLIGDRTAAQDLVQETFLAAFQGLGRFEGRSSVRTWLTAILVRQAAQHHRRGALRRTVSLDQPAAAEEPSLAARSHAASTDARLDVAAALQELSREYRQVIVLRELEGLSYQEIAQTLGVPRGTVESRLHRARAALRERLGMDWG